MPEVSHGARVSDLERWRKGPAPRGSGQSVARYLDQVAEISGLGLGKLGIEVLVPPRRLAELARYGMTASASLIRRHPEGRRLATLLATVAFVSKPGSEDQADVMLRYNFPGVGLSDDALRTLLLMVLDNGAEVRRALTS